MERRLVTHVRPAGDWSIENLLRPALEAQQRDLLGRLPSPDLIDDLCRVIDARARSAIAALEGHPIRISTAATATAAHLPLSRMKALLGRVDLTGAPGTFVEFVLTTLGVASSDADLVLRAWGTKRHGPNVPGVASQKPPTPLARYFPDEDARHGRNSDAIAATALTFLVTGSLTFVYSAYPQAHGYWALDRLRVVDQAGEPKEVDPQRLLVKRAGTLWDGRVPITSALVLDGIANELMRAARADGCAQLHARRRALSGRLEGGLRSRNVAGRTLLEADGPRFLGAELVSAASLARATGITPAFDLPADRPTNLRFQIAGTMVDDATLLQDLPFKKEVRDGRNPQYWRRHRRHRVGDGHYYEIALSWWDAQASAWRAATMLARVDAYMRFSRYLVHGSLRTEAERDETLAALEREATRADHATAMTRARGLALAAGVQRSEAHTYRRVQTDEQIAVLAANLALARAAL